MSNQAFKDQVRQEFYHKFTLEPGEGHALREFPSTDPELLLEFINEKIDQASSSEEMAPEPEVTVDEPSEEAPAPEPVEEPQEEVAAGKKPKRRTCKAK